MDEQTIKDMIIALETKHNERLTLLEKYVFGDPPFGPTDPAVLSIRKQLDSIISDVRELKSNLITISELIPMMKALADRVALLEKPRNITQTG